MLSPTRSKPAERKPRLCALKACRAEFLPARPMQRACSVHCALELIEDKKARTQAMMAKADRIATRKALEKLKPLRTLLNEAQTAFNAMIRARDHAEPCISCGVAQAAQWDASHFFSRGARPELRFHESNCFKACQVCNQHLSGNLIPYRANLIAKIGQEAFDAMESAPPRKWQRDEVIAMKAEFRARTREMEKRNADR